MSTARLALTKLGLRSGRAFVHQMAGVYCFFVQPESTVNSALHPEVIRRLEETPQAELPLATEGALRYLWESRFGAMLIEVEDGVIRVNGARVEPASTGAVPGR